MSLPRCKIPAFYRLKSKLTSTMMKTMKRYGVAALVAAALTAVAGCQPGVGDDDTAGTYQQSDPAYNVGVYEGEWSVNRQVVDTARMTVTGATTIHLRLPHDYLAGLCYPGATAEAANEPAVIKVREQGYSEQSLYMAFVSMQVAFNTQLYFNTCSFEATVGNERWRVGLLSRENASAVQQIATGMWSLAIPIDGFQVTNLETGRTEERRLNTPTILYYNTKGRVR